MTTQWSRYFYWLKSQVENAGDYERVLVCMSVTEFAWLPNLWGDENRVQDGLALRHEWNPNITFQFPCSVLEVMIALSRRMEFTVGGTAPGWAWQFMLNLGLEKYKDPLSERRADQVGDLLHALIWRTYSPDGQGGFFPLQNPDDDQTQLEIWYQMSGYIEEILPD
jgi:hypothetical protein